MGSSKMAGFITISASSTLPPMKFSLDLFCNLEPKLDTLDVF